MGSVWRAVHLELDTPVAVKFPHAHRSASEDAVRRFRREARAAARLRSPHVVRIVDFGLEEGAPFLVMEHLEGEALEARLDRRARSSLDEATEVARQVAQGLDAAHGAGIVHRDIKPSNLFMAREGEHEIVKVLDFGIAKWSEATLQGSASTTGSELVVGSAPYLSPEQARGEDVDSRSDVWSLGVVVYRMLTGVLPFRGTNVPDTLQRICAGVHEAPSLVLGSEYAELDPVFERALAVDRKRRFDSAGEFARALTHACHELPQQVRTSTGIDGAPGLAFGRDAPTRTVAGMLPQRRARLGRRWLASLTAGGILLLAALAGVPWLYTRGSPTPTRTPARFDANGSFGRTSAGPGVLDTPASLPVAARPETPELHEASEALVRSPERRSHARRPPRAPRSTDTPPGAAPASSAQHGRLHPVFGLEVPGSP
jgi:serine/threonine-protein kinase